MKSGIDEISKPRGPVKETYCPRHYALNKIGQKVSRKEFLIRSPDWCWHKEWKISKELREPQQSWWNAFLVKWNSSFSLTHAEPRVVHAVVQKWALWSAAGGPVRACVSSRDPARSMLSLCLFFGYHWHGGVVSLHPGLRIYKRALPPLLNYFVPMMRAELFKMLIDFQIKLSSAPEQLLSAELFTGDSPIEFVVCTIAVGRKKEREYTSAFFVLISRIAFSFDLIGLIHMGVLSLVIVMGRGTGGAKRLFWYCTAKA